MNLDYQGIYANKQRIGMPLPNGVSSDMGGTAVCLILEQMPGSNIRRRDGQQNTYHDYISKYLQMTEVRSF